MSVKNLELNFRTDVSGLESEEDFRAEAKRLLPDAIQQLGEQSGKLMWDETQKAFKGVKGFKGNSSSSDKQKFIRNAGQEYARKISSSDKRTIEDHLVKLLKQKAGKL